MNMACSKTTNIVPSGNYYITTPGW